MDIKVEERIVKTITLELTPDEAAMLWQVALYHYEAANWNMTHESGDYKKTVTEKGKAFFKALANGIEKNEGLPFKQRATAYEEML